MTGERPKSIAVGSTIFEAGLPKKTFIIGSRKVGQRLLGKTMGYEGSAMNTNRPRESERE